MSFMFKWPFCGPKEWGHHYLEQVAAPPLQDV